MDILLWSVLMIKSPEYNMGSLAVVATVSLGQAEANQTALLIVGDK